MPLLCCHAVGFSSIPPQPRQFHANPAAERWFLTSLRETLIKIGAKMVSHGRHLMSR
jgi:hypothetical protein